MSKKVSLDELIFTMSWEDPELDRAAFGHAPGKCVATVGSGGCNTLTFLLDDPERIFAFDFNQTQVWLLELKIAAFRFLDHDQVLELFGVRESSRRANLFRVLSGGLSAGARSYFEDTSWLFERGLLGGGRYERSVAAFRALLRLIQGKRKIARLFEPKSEAERERFYAEEWDTAAWRVLFKLFFNKRVLASRGLSADYFHFADGSASFAESFARRTKHALTELPVRENPFVAQYTLGKYVSEDCLPEYLRPANFELIKSRLERIENVQLDVRHFKQRVGTARFDGICLSNVFELMSNQETQRALTEVAETLAPGGRITLRNLMVPREAAADTGLTLDAVQSRALAAADRSFVYRAIHVYSKGTER
jgi:S-adenosylmethionine-diacylglycerol 3-amino-3-carboxypropyl transferase